MISTNNHNALSKTKPSSRLTERHLNVSVVVPVRNRANQLGDCLESVLGLNYAPCEVIVVDDQSDDGSWDVASRYPVKLLQGGGKGAYAARNIGIGAARGEVIAFTDADCIVDKGWLKCLARCYRDDTVAGVGGRVLSSEARGVFGAYQSLGPQEVIDSDRRLELPSPERGRFVSGFGSGNMSYRLQALKEVNGFSEDMDKCGDYEVCWRLQALGRRLVYEPSAKVYHKPRGTFAELVTQSYRFGKSQPQLLRKRHDGYSYFELKTYLFRTREYRIRLPIQMLISIDFFGLATVALILAVLDADFLILFFALAVVCYTQAWRKTQSVSGLALRAELLIVFPFLHAIKSYAQSLGRVVGGVANRIIAL